MRLLYTAACAALLTACGGGTDTGGTDVDDEKTSEISASPTAPGIASNPNKNAYFGDLHIHTRNSFDAYIFNVRVTPDDVYRFAMGETLKHPAGYDITLSGPPLDFVAATDHGAYLGIMPAMDNPDHPLSEQPLAKQLFSTDRDVITQSFQFIGSSVRSGEPIAEIYDPDYSHSIWQETKEVADKYYKPGKLTTFSGYEYTSVTNVPGEDGTFGGGNLHRNVFFKDKAPDTLFSTLNSTNPEDLWDWMDTQRAAGMDVISVPHNSNVSNGLMFDSATYDGDELTAAYSEQRLRNEPIVEITQVKGTSETHPALSPNDEYANFEIYEKLLGSYITSKVNGGYVREALGRGMLMEDADNFNPYKFGFIGSSDTHVAGGGFDEKDYWSKVGIVDGTAEFRGSVPPGGAKTWEGVQPHLNAREWFSKWSASGFAAVWAEENTRESIFDAMRRRETFATSGTRIKVRFFGGFDYSDDLIGDANLVSKAYASGEPMGGELQGAGEAPTFLAWAMRDPRGAPLDRLQIVKVWTDNGVYNEAVYDAACSDGGEVNPATYRCPDNGASVDVSDCSFSADKGDAELKVSWKDPSFDPQQRSSYYVRVLENPTCRWSTWDALKAGVEPNPSLPATLQERAWTSPIWYTPQQ